MATHLVVVSQDLCEVKRRLSAPIRLELRNQNEMHEIWPPKSVRKHTIFGGAGALLDTCEQTPNVVYGIGNNLNELFESTSQDLPWFLATEICDRPVVFQWENCAMPASLRAGQSRAVPQI